MACSATALESAATLSGEWRRASASVGARALSLSVDELRLAKRAGERRRGATKFHDLRGELSVLDVCRSLPPCGGAIHAPGVPP